MSACANCAASAVSLIRSGIWSGAARSVFGNSGAVVALEQRIPLQLLLDEARHLDVGILQQLDRLPQLRRHDQRLRLAKIEAWP